MYIANVAREMQPSSDYGSSKSLATKLTERYRKGKEEVVAKAMCWVGNN